VSWRYLIDVLEIYLNGVLKIFEEYPGDIYSVSWKYMMVVLEKIILCAGDI